MAIKVEVRKGQYGTKFWLEFKWRGHHFSQRDSFGLRSTADEAAKMLEEDLAKGMPDIEFYDCFNCGRSFPGTGNYCCDECERLHQIVLQKKKLEKAVCFYCTDCNCDHCPVMGCPFVVAAFYKLDSHGHYERSKLIGCSSQSEASEVAAITSSAGNWSTEIIRVPDNDAV